uniref:Secreted protein n=1 Tax=Ascaris lumbricoides TaxID=6252 RepID=A0A0M3IUI3_ASCLU
MHKSQRLRFVSCADGTGMWSCIEILVSRYTEIEGSRRENYFAVSAPSDRRHSSQIPVMFYLLLKPLLCSSQRPK